MTDEQRGTTVAAVERWFEENGLPYFVAGNERRVLVALRRTRLVPVISLVLLVGAAAGVGVGLLATDISTGVLVGAVAIAAIGLVYALVSLHLQPIVRWAVRRTFGSLGWIFPLITRALPLLLLFAGVAIAFLLVRLPEEVRQVSDDASAETLVRICRGTPVEAVAVEVTGEAAAVELSPLQRANLVLVLLFSQALQVLLLAFSVFVFFIVFGKVAISDSVIRAWLGDEYPGGTDIPSHLPSLDWLPVSNELFQVSIFLAAFSGLYFTVYAVTDQTYREQFFTSISGELERAIGVQTVYRAVTGRSR